MDVKHVAITSLREDQQNARKHNKWNVEAIKASYERFGQQRPIVVDATGTIIAGNAQWRAAKELGWPGIDVVVTQLSGADAVAYAVTDNRTSELGEWDMDTLSQQIAALQSEEFDMGALGWSDAALDALIGDLGGEPGGTAAEPTHQARGTTLKLTAEQWEQVEPAVVMVMRMTDEAITKGEALALIAQHFVDSHASGQGDDERETAAVAAGA